MKLNLKINLIKVKAFLLFIAFQTTVNAQTWDTVGAGLNFNVWGMLNNPNDNKLYIAGEFSASGSIPLELVAAWNGTTYEALGAGFNNISFAFALYNNEVYCGGLFTSSGITPLNRIAKWNGTQWQDVGGGMNGVVYYLTTYNGELYAGGMFSLAGGTPASCIAKWNGTSWSALGSGLGGATPQVYSMIEYNGLLYVAGQFTDAGGVPVNNIAVWNGTNWSDVGGGVTGSFNFINDLYVFNGELYVTGSFTNAGVTSAISIARWDGTTWSAVGSGLSGGLSYGNVLMEYNGELYLGGNFTDVDGVSALNIASYNGSVWKPLTSGCDQEVTALEVFQGELYAGGIFVVAGGLNASKIARWQNCTLSASLSGNDASCAGTCDGSALVTATGQSPFTYQWSTGSTDDNVQNLCAGTYTVTVTDVNGCSVTETIVISEPAAMTLTLTSTDPTCNGVCNGTAEAIATGSGSLSFLWNTVPAQTASVATNLCAGTYSVVVTDDNGCTITDSITLSDPNYTLNVFSAYPTCNNACDGEATALYSSPFLPLTYSWNTNPPQNTETATGLCPGVYTVVVTDANNCSATDSTVVYDPGYFITVLTTSPSCQQFCDGEATAFLSSPYGPYSYYWNTSPQQTTQTATGLCAGWVSVTITDDQGCAITDSVEIVDPPPYPLTFYTQPESCPGNCDGLAAVFPGSTAAPFQYFWNTNPVQTTDTAFNMCPGVYTVTVIDSNGCASTDEVVVPDSPVQLSFQITPATCAGGCDGAITAIHSGTPPFSYFWLTGDTTATITGLCPATYLVTVVDSNGCAISGIPEIQTPQPPVVSLTGVPVQCAQDCNGQVSAAVSGNSPFTYLWSNGSTNASIDSLCPGWYVVTVTDAGGCVSTDSLLLFPPNPVDINPLSFTHVSCYGDCNGTANVVASGGTGSTYTYLWNFGQTTSSVSGLCAGTYTVTGFDSLGCPSNPLSITINQPDSIDITLVPTSASCQTCNDGSIAVTVTGGTPPYQYFWTPPVSNLNQLTTGWYYLCIVDGNNCQQCDSVFVGYTIGIATAPINSKTLRIYPNPMNETSRIEIPDSAKGKISVTDLTGRRIKDVPVSGQRYYILHRQELTPGIYLISFSDESGNYFRSRLTVE